jgi:diguanylate cyclase (GGDEF)-like protein
VFTGAVFLICAIALLTRVIGYLPAVLGDSPSLPLSSQVNTYTYLAMSTAGILMTFGYLLMGHDHDIRELREIESRMRHLAQHDALTDLPNRALFNDRLGRALANARRENKRLALMFLDVNRFKSVNDNLGHGVGDAYLQELARRLTMSVREQDTAARLGGDEFVILLPVIHSPDDARTIADKVMTTLNRPVMIQGSELRFYVSVGIACYPEDGSTAEALQQAADRSMYCAKSAGDNEVRLHSEQKPAVITADLFAKV